MRRLRLRTLPRRCLLHAECRGRAAGDGGGGARIWRVARRAGEKMRGRRGEGRRSPPSRRNAFLATSHASAAHRRSCALPPSSPWPASPRAAPPPLRGPARRTPLPRAGPLPPRERRATPCRSRPREPVPAHPPWPPRLLCSASKPPAPAGQICPLILNGFQIPPQWKLSCHPSFLHHRSDPSPDPHLARNQRFSGRRPSVRPKIHLHVAG